MTLLFTGCNGSQPEPTYYPNLKKIIFSNGKPYRIPYGTIITSRSLSAESAKTTRKLTGMDCRTGDLEWHEIKDLNMWKTNLEAGASYEEAMAGLRKASLEGKAGCTRPLSDREYKFYLNQQNQQAANYRATATRNVNYNVSHSGYIDTYRY